MAIKNILTVDVEDWYHICDIEGILPPSSWDRCENRILRNLEKILTLFGRYRTQATFFVLGYVAERNPEILRMISREGHEIASHGYGHVQAYRQTKEEFLQDLLRSKSLIEGMIGERVIGYRAPQWSICGTLQKAEDSKTRFVMKANKGKRDSFWAVDLLVQNGFQYDSSIAPLHFIGIPNAPTTPYTLSTRYGEIKEYPPLVIPSFLGNLPIGGGWGLRVFPYRSIRKAILQYHRLDYPVLIFCHPSDFDSYFPPLRLPWIKRFVCYGKIKTTEERITRLLSEFEFSSVREALQGKEANGPTPPITVDPRRENRVE